MILNYSDIPGITFPIYKLPSDNWSVSDGLVYLDGFILDDRNMPGETLGLRRLQTSQQPLFKLAKGKTTIYDLLKHKHFIDSKGRCFTYEKTKLCALKYYRIKHVEKRDTYSLLHLIGLSFPIEIQRPPPYYMSYARVLFLGPHPWLIYDYSMSVGKDTKRKI